MKESRIKYFIGVAEAVAKASVCTRKKFGAILVKNGDIVSTGYNGSVRGAWNCGKDIVCIKDAHDEPHYTSYNYCPAIHAEHNACLNAGRPIALGSTMFLAKGSGDGMSGRPCINCRRVMINAGIKDIYYYGLDGSLVHEEVKDWIYLDNQWMSDGLSDSYTLPPIDSWISTDSKDWEFVWTENNITENTKSWNFPEQQKMTDFTSSDPTAFRCYTCKRLMTHDEFHQCQGLCKDCCKKEKEHDQ